MDPYFDWQATNFFLPFFSANEVEVFFVAEDYIKSWIAIAKGD